MLVRMVQQRVAGGVAFIAAAGSMSGRSSSMQRWKQQTTAMDVSTSRVSANADRMCEQRGGCRRNLLIRRASSKR
jgi:hypothetical protein